MTAEQHAGISFTSGLTTGRPGNVFQESDPVLISFKDEAFRKTCVRELEWRVTDWLGGECAGGICGPADAAIRIPGLPLGYYSFYVREKGSSGSWGKPLTFARIVDYSSRKINPDMPYAADGAQSDVCTRYHGTELAPEDKYEIIAELEKLAGLALIRERMSWNNIHKESGEFEWSIFGQNIDLLSRRGVRVLEMFANCPEWTQGAYYSPNFPQDFIATYRFTREAAGRFKDQVVAWEFFNEMDAHIDSVSAWDFAAAHKVAYLGFKAGNPDANVLYNSISVWPPNVFSDLVMQNGVGSYFDTFNLHLYATTDYYPERIKGWLKPATDFMKRHGITKPMWITENGCAGEGDGRSQPYLPKSDVREHDEEQERMQAESLVKSQISMQALGFAKDFSFLFAPYNEGGKVWGLLRFDYTVKPGYVALANLTEQLGWSRFRGTIDLAPEVFGFLFADPDGSQTVVAWTMDSDRTVVLENRADTVRLIDLMGTETRPVPQDDAYTIAVGKYPVYLRGLRNLNPTRPAVVADAVTESDAMEDKDVVLRIMFDGDQKILGRTSLLLDNLTTCRASLDIFNFGKERKTIALRNLGTGYVLETDPAEVSVEPIAVRTIPITIRLSSPENVVLKLGATVGRKQVSPIVVPISLPLETNQAYQARQLLTKDASRWRANSAGTMQIEFDSREQAVRFQTTFPEEMPLGSARWIYPEYLLKLPEENMAAAVGIGFDVKVREFETRYADANLMAVMEGDPDVYYSYKLTTGHEGWQTVTIPLQAAAPVGFEPGAIRMLRIGMNPQADDFTYWVKDVKVYYREFK